MAKEKPPNIPIGSRWTYKEIEATLSHPVKVMAYVDGYVMARHKGAVPFLVHWREWLNRFVEIECDVEESPSGSFFSKWERVIKQIDLSPRK